MKRKIIFILAFFITSSFFYALPFNSELKKSEKEILEKGEVLIRNIDYPKYMCLKEDNEACKKLLKSINETNPNYLAEVIQIKPYQGNEDLPQKIRNALENIQDYAGIPYWSERHQRYWDLYSSSEVLSQKTEGEKTFLETRLYMEPFGDIFCPIYIEEIPFSEKDENSENVEKKSEGYIFYTQTNSNKLTYEGFTCVKPYAMKSAIILFREGDKWILYGAGGVKAPRVPFLTARIETSFINRIKTFCNFIFTKI